MWVDSARLFKCMACQKDFRTEMLQDVPISVWTAHIKTLHCPHCGVGWKQIAFKLEGAEVGAKLPAVRP